jgi:hypothetical protein
MALALAALGWTCSDQPRAERLLSLTGLDPEALRAGLDDRTVMLAVLNFLADHEPDLIKCAEALAITPEELIAARADLSQGPME